MFTELSDLTFTVKSSDEWIGLYKIILTIKWANGLTTTESIAIEIYKPVEGAEWAQKVAEAREQVLPLIG